MGVSPLEVRGGWESIGETEVDQTHPNRHTIKLAGFMLYTLRMLT